MKPHLTLQKIKGTAITPKMVATPELAAAADTYLSTKHKAEQLRATVTAVHTAILKDIPITYKPTENSRPVRVKHPEDVWNCEDTTKTTLYIQECDKRLKALGIKPQNMEEEICPALSLETQNRKQLAHLIDIAGKPLGITSLQLMRKGQETTDRFLQLVFKLLSGTLNWQPPKL